MTHTAEHTSHYENEFRSNPLYDCDPRAFDLLNVEVLDVRNDGYEINVGSSHDPAYERPDKIVEVYDYLKVRDLQLAEARGSIIRSELGSLGVNPLKRSARKKKLIYSALEPLREDLLFGENETDSMPWHRQRGRAAALITIAQAHELETPSSPGLYPTMSGLLDTSLVAHQFGPNDDGVANMSLRDAIIHAETTYGKRDTRIAALIAEKRIKELEEFVTSPTSDRFKEVVQYCSDSLGIRARKEEVNGRLNLHIDDQIQNGRDPHDILMMSFGCGTALPMLEVLRDIKTAYGAAPKLILLDQDPLALAAAFQLAKKMDLEDSIEIHCARLFSRFGAPVDLETILHGRELDIAEDSGLREYLDDRTYKKLTRETWSRLKEGGLMTTGNMNANRPQAEFLHGMMGWQPSVQMRGVKDGFRLHESAGVPKGSSRGVITRDGIYTMIYSTKSSSSPVSFAA